MGFGWIAILLVVELIIAACAAVEFHHIAAEKGYDEGKYFWWTFLVFPVGALMVVALPNKRAAAPYTPLQQPTNDDMQLPEL